MKAVMLSVKPKFCELIVSGKKTVEVRKTMPKLETPFKCYIYCTKDKSRRLFVDELHEDYAIPHIANGKVIGKFVCDFVYENIGYDTQGSCVSVDELKRYANGKPLYGWHISDLVIYDKPKELNEFCAHDNTYDNAFGYIANEKQKSVPLKKPPQSWCYVEELSV